MGEHHSCIFHCEERFLKKCGGEGCLEVFDRRALREELGFTSHAVPHPF